MKKTHQRTFIACFLWLFSGQTLADFRDQVINCYNITNPETRLVCYDQLALKENPSLANSNPSVAVKPVNPKQITPPLTTNQPTAQLAKSVTSVSHEAASFGVKSYDLRAIQSRMIGDFKRWEKGMLIELENGQIWKVTSQKTGYKKLHNPMVTITRGSFDSFNARVEGLSARAPVRRIK